MKIICRTKKIVEYDTECALDNYCCKKMKKAMTIKNSASYCGYHEPVFAIKNGRLIIHLLGSEYGNGSNTEIHYCPWCGEEIEYENA